MRLYLVQHGQAMTEGEDPERPLTAHGIEDVTGVTHYAVERLGVRPARVVHSGKTRARQTAEIWGGQLNGHVEQGDGLAPNDDPTSWIARIDAETDDLMLVGHLPCLSPLAGVLLTGASDRAVVRFEPAGLVGLERIGTDWLVWVVLPPPQGR